ncbi:regulatory protein RecX [Aquabacterium sp.]|uniref:regulatory protein RecX n=1 Tax=Aquabacterium sp. TaxID=1872578 RepID=UPI003783E4D3
MAARPASLKVRALQWLAQREHSPLELRGKLLRLLQDGQRRSAAAAGDGDPAAPDAEAAAAEVDALLEWLSQHGFLSQQRFVESRVQARQARFGNLRIQRELQQHGAVLDAPAREALHESEFDRAREVWRKKFGRTAAAPADAAAAAAARLRQMRFLTGRGFSPEVIRRVLARAGESDT